MFYYYSNIQWDLVTEAGFVCVCLYSEFMPMLTEMLWKHLYLFLITAD